MSEKYITPLAVCEQLNISRKTLQRLLRAKKITHVLVGSQFRIAESALAAYLSKRTVVAAPGKAA
jgi:excisionase family DNA binding protein